VSENKSNTGAGKFRWFSSDRQIALNLTMLTLTCGLAMTAHAQPPTASVLAAEPLLNTPITLTVDEQPAGDLLRHILTSVSPGAAANIQAQATPIRTLWIDRRVDLGVRVSLSEVATPAAKVILDLAQRQKLAVFPLPGVLLVGRDQWVDATVGNMRLSDPGVDDGISITWPTGSTAAEVLALMLLAPSIEKVDQAATDLASIMPTADAPAIADFAPSWVPHDVWSAGSFNGVDRGLAVDLLLAQFDCALKPGTRLETLRGSEKLPAGVRRLSDLPPAPAFALKYPMSDSVKAIRESLASVKPRPIIRVSGKNLLINCTAASHRRAIDVHWRLTAEQQTKGRPAVIDPKAVFELKLINQPAAIILRKLAGTAGKTLRIEPNAELASEQLISLDEQKKTLPELAEIVAESAGLRVRWSEDEVVVSK
jgi:hypothetical protein